MGSRLRQLRRAAAVALPARAARPFKLAAPWSFSEAPKPGEPTIENAPTPEGRLLGLEIARLVDIEEQRSAADFPDQHPRCTDCAARAGTLPNGCEEPLFDLIKCAAEGVPFYCHKGMKEGESPKRLCVGWVHLQRAAQRANEPLIQLTAQGAR
jgi:hypothetical protein